MSAVIKFPGPSAPHTPPQKEARVVADLDDGFTRTANEIQKAKCRLRMAGRELNVLDAVIYSTYGWNKKQDRLTNTYLAELCDMDPSDVNKALQVLSRRHIITLEKHGHMKIVGVNKVVSEWEYSREKQAKTPTAQEKNPGKNTQKNPGKITQISGYFDLSNQAKTPNTQDSLTKDNKNKDLKPSSSKNADALLDAGGDESVSPPAEKVRPDAAVQTPSGKFWGTQDDLTAAEFIHGKVLVVNPTAKAPNWAQWANEIRLMRVQDGRTHHEICSLFKWTNLDPFWSANVLCPKTLRKQWDKLTAKRAGVVRQPVRGDEWDLTKTMTADKLNQLIQEGY
ncbi:replication protein 15 [Aeromonas rivipollensis]|uniref:Replication protein 15 n=1 Tax=Aeromonas rivipollensis TaxID=948519 RepID=A0ABX0D394_9GAMM|nr:replication protein [Aeromonas rivipollensis]NEX88343.1 replication protein 15 [Aeromonas rivipollensis]NEY06062.1 replication protein 15 [Aeromonas rivipollensis]